MRILAIANQKGGSGKSTTTSSLAVTAFGREIDRLERRRGESFPHRHGRLRTGRPVG